MRTAILLSTCLFCSQSFAAGNLLTNADFKQGMHGWWSSVSATMQQAGCQQGIEQDHWKAIIPPAVPSEPTGVLLGCTAQLDYGRIYRLTYSLHLEHAGTMRHLYQMSQRPYRTLGLAENIPVQPGMTKISATFTSGRPDDTAAHVTFNLSQLTGTVRLGDFSIEEVGRLSVTALNDTWTIFPDVTLPETLSAVPAQLTTTKGRRVAPQSAQLTDHEINLARLPGVQFRPGAQALLFNEFTSPRPSLLELGLSASSSMTVYLNGKAVSGELGPGYRTDRFTANEHVVTLPVEAGQNVLAVTVQASSQSWRFICGTPDPPIQYTANANWKAVEMSNVQVQPGSALDLSALVDKPAGKQGRIVIGPGGQLAFADAPGRSIRLLGFNGFPSTIWYESDDEVFRAQTRLFAQAARRQGYRLFRVHGLLDRSLCQDATEDLSIQPQHLARWDFLLSELKREGIYCHLVILSFGLYERGSVYRTTFDERDLHKLRLYLGGEWERAHFRYGAESLLHHVNPYTGLAWKDDPAIAFVEFYNEQELGLERMAQPLAASPELSAFLERKWREWLGARFRDELPAALQAELNGVPLRAAPLPPLHDRQSELANQFALFQMHIAVNCAKWCESVVRGTGYGGLTTQYNGSKSIGNSAVRWQVSQVGDMHAYYRHPSGGWGAAGTRVEQSSSLADAAGYWRNTNATRLSGRPFIVSEFNHCFWNPYQHEGGLVFGAYSALQGFGALEIHSGPVSLDVGLPKIGSFTCAASPVVRANEFLAACLYQRRDVAEAKHRIELVVPEHALTTASTSRGAVSTEQSKIALLTGFSLAFPWAERPPGTHTGSAAQMRILPTGVAAVNAQDWFVDVIESQDGRFALTEMVHQMKDRGILSADNLTDPEQAVYHSDTGEVVLRAREHLLKVHTPRTEAVALEAEQEETIGALTVNHSSVPACIAVCSTTSHSVTESPRLVLIYSTEMVNTGMVVGHDRQLMKNTGQGPALLRCGQLRATLICEQPGSFALYALGFDGARRQQLPVSTADGKLVIKIDTTMLADGPTPFFELVRTK